MDAPSAGKMPAARWLAIGFQSGGHPSVCLKYPAAVSYSHGVKLCCSTIGGSGRGAARALANTNLESPGESFLEVTR